MNVQSYISNIVFPYDFDEFCYYIDNEILFDPEVFLYLEKGECVEWTAPRWCKGDDICFFMFSCSSKRNIAHIRHSYLKKRDGMSVSKQKNCESRLEGVTKLHEFAGRSIYAIGRVVGDKIYDENPEKEIRHWKSNIYARISDIFILKRPIPIDEFKEYLTISATGSVTPVMGESFDKLKEDILKYNRECPSYFLDAVATPTPLSTINKENWLRLNQEYRNNYFLESQFRAYYVDFFLKELSDISKIYRECRCIKNSTDNKGIADNVIKINGMYLPVEVKLSIEHEKDIIAQVKKYCSVDYCFIEKDKSIDGFKMYNYVLIIDTQKICIYDFCNNNVQKLIDLDEIKTISDISNIKKRIKDITKCEDSRKYNNREIDIEDTLPNEIYGGIVETTSEGNIPEGLWDEFNRQLRRNR